MHMLKEHFELTTKFQNYCNRIRLGFDEVVDFDTINSFLYFYSNEQAVGNRDKEGFFYFTYNDEVVKFRDGELREDFSFYYM